MQYIIKKLLKMITAENKEEEEIEGIVDTKFKEIIAKGKIDRKITTTETMKAIKRMKNKKAGDKNKWKTDWIKKKELKWYRVQQLCLTEQKKRTKFQYNEGKQKLSRFTKEETKKGYKKVKERYF